MIPSATDFKIMLTTLSDLVKKGMTVEAQEKIMDLREMVQSLREQCVELKEENMLLKKRLSERDSVIFREGTYWTKKEDDSLDGPFCLPCRDNNGKLVRLGDNGEKYYCPVKGCTFQHRYKPGSDVHGVSTSRGDLTAGY